MINSESSSCMKALIYFSYSGTISNFLVERLTPACINAHEKTCEIIKNKKIKAFLSAGFDSCTSHSAARAARNLDIPVIAWRHSGYDPMEFGLSKYIYLMSSDIFFLFGERTVDKFLKSAKYLM